MVENGNTKHLMTAKEALDLVVTLHDRLHSYWSVYAGATLVFVGWLFSISPASLGPRRWLLTIAALGGTAMSLISITAAYRYLRVVIEEAQLAAREVTFRSSGLQQLIDRLRLLPIGVAVLIQMTALSLILAVIWMPTQK